MSRQNYKNTSMCSTYTRPELTKADLRDFKIAKYVTLNPERDDIVKALKAAEKSTRKHHLAPEEALAVYDRFTENTLPTASAGEYRCDSHSRYPIQGTVIQLIRLTDSLTGLICDRQSVEPGHSSKPPLRVPPEGLLTGKSPLGNLNKALTYFWPYLSDDALDELYTQCSVYIMGTLVPSLKAQRENRLSQRSQQEMLEIRKKALATLYRDVKPEFTTEFAQQCKTIAEELEQEGKQCIKWSELKKQYPATSSRHQAQLLGILDNNKVTVKVLKEAEDQTNFDVRLSTWRGAMRVFDAPQLVLQIRNIPVHHRFAQKGPRYKELSDDIKTQARNLCHPATENTIGWLRIHIDDENKLCFVDEVQSDAIELAREYSSDIRYTDAAKAFQDECSSWNLHAFATVYQWANNIGYRPAIHSRESAEKVACMTRSDRKWNEYYNVIIKKFALEKESVDHYPAHIFIGE